MFLYAQPMAQHRFSTRHLIFKALCALDEVVELSNVDPVPQTAAIRFALAYLWSVSSGKDRQCYVDFWNVIQGRGATVSNPHMAERMRGTYARTHYQSISRSVGVEYTVVEAERMRAATHAVRRRAV
jgi:hypothetical protein